MSNRKQQNHMWGCWVVWKGPTSKLSGWMWEAIDGRANNPYYPTVFTVTREAIMPLVRYMRRQNHIKSATAIKVPIPELP